MPTPRILTWSAVSTKVQAKDDKFSIPDQIRMGREIVTRLDGVLVDELIVPGFSRNYRTLADIVTATDDTETDAFRKLDHYIKTRAFDVFACVDADRFGRKASLVLQIIDLITDEMGAQLITYIDNMTMDDENSLTVGLLKAYKAQMDMKRLRDSYYKGMDQRARDGRSTSTILPLFHRRERDLSSGKDGPVTVNEDLRPLWTDLATCILNHVEWERMEDVLFQQYGHGREGEPYNRMYFRTLVMNPSFWGHVSKRRRRKGDVRRRFYGPWLWDETIDPPKGLTLYRHRRPAVYSGPYAELGERVKQELWRRYRLEGKATSNNTYRFHGLFICDECGHTLSKHATKRNRVVYMRCDTRWRRKERPEGCTQVRYFPTDAIEAFLTDELEDYLAGVTTTVFSSAGNVRMLEATLERERAQLAKSRTRLENLVTGFADAPEAARAVFHRQMEVLSDEIERATASIQNLEHEMLARRDIRQAQEAALVDLRANGVPWLWTQPDTKIHRVLVAILGDNQLVVRDNEILGSAPIRNPKLLTRRRRES